MHTTHYTPRGIRRAAGGDAPEQLRLEVT